MKAFLMYAGRDFDLAADLPDQVPALIQDLGLDTLFAVMSGGDEFLLEVAQRGVLTSLQDPGEIGYRQRVLRDCLDHPAVVRQMYDVAVEAVLGSKRIYRGIFSQSPDGVLRWSVEALQLFVGQLRQLRQIADEQAASFRSEGFTALFATLARELSDDYFQSVNGHLAQLRFRGGVLISAGLGPGHKGAGYVLRRPGPRKQSFLRRISGSDRNSYTLRIPDRDESGHRTLADLRGRGINLAANALAQSTDHILSFLTMLRCELGFYVGCLNAADHLAGKQEPFCFPQPHAPGAPVTLSFRGLYDICLSLRLDDGRAVGNSASADGKALVIITGANQGGKSTFLRSVGLAQLMMQCGMFVAAESLSATVCTGLFTHYRREEDAEMESGKLDEELSRMSHIADSVTPGSVVLFNESFAATNEREGSAIARQIVRALVESGVRVFLVTHFFDLAHSLYQQGSGAALFLRAQRRDDGQRTFRLVEGEPEPTSYGQDLYEQIFGAQSAAVSAERSPSHPPMR
jgi:DNA mismatch repair ATPase MutS